MKNIVAIDTSTEACSVALQCNGESAFRYVVEPRMHAKLLLPMLDELFAEAGIVPLQLDGVAFARGPGAFTGVRIGTAAAQAIALAADVAVAPVSSLAAIAHRAYREHGKDKVAVAIDARMAEVYWGAYHLSDQGALLIGRERVCAASEVDLPETDFHPAGTGWQAYQQELHTRTGLVATDSLEPFPHALDVLKIGTHKIRRGEGVAAEYALPVYLRDNVAQTEAQRSER